MTSSPTDVLGQEASDLSAKREEDVSSSSTGLLVVVMLIVVTAVIVVGGVYFYKKKMQPPSHDAVALTRVSYLNDSFFKHIYLNLISRSKTCQCGPPVFVTLRWTSALER